jgi:hypothetical protein
MFSSILTNVSPSGKLVTTASPSGTPTCAQISMARGRLELPEKIFKRGAIMWAAIVTRLSRGGSLF